MALYRTAPCRLAWSIANLTLSIRPRSIAGGKVEEISTAGFVGDPNALCSRSENSLERSSYCLWRVRHNEVLYMVLTVRRTPQMGNLSIGCGSWTSEST